MNIIILTSSFDKGGAEKHGFILADYFKNQKGYDCEFWVMSHGSGALKEACMAAGINTKEIGVFSRFGRFLGPFQQKKFIKQFKSFNPDVIISFNLKPNLLNAYVGKKAGAKCVVWSQQNRQDCNHLNEHEIGALKQCDCFISNSKHGAKFLIDKFHLDQNHVHFVPNGFPSKNEPLNSTETWKNKLGIKSTQYVAVMAAHLEKRKDHDTLLKAWKIFVDRVKKKNCEEPVLLLAGNFSPNTQKLVQYCVENNIYKNVQFLGNIKDITGLLRMAKVFVFSSNTEGMPNAIVEAMYEGLPIVANDIEGNKEALSPHNLNYIAKSKNPEDFADKIFMFYNDQNLSDDVGHKNMEYATKTYTQNKLGDETFNVIKKYI
jgi:glycosyltransferase involved in cell wall biosynthesis